MGQRDTVELAEVRRVLVLWQSAASSLPEVSPCAERFTPVIIAAATTLSGSSNGSLAPAGPDSRRYFEHSRLSLGFGTTSGTISLAN